jgi:hypothetical protein
LPCESAQPVEFTDNALPGTSGLTVAWMMLRDPKGVADQFRINRPMRLSYLSLMPVAGLREFRLLSTHIDFRWVMLRRRHQTIMEPAKKPTHSVIRFKDSQSAIDGTLEVWLPRLLESNDALEEALLLSRDIHLGRYTTDESRCPEAG